MKNTFKFMLVALAMTVALASCGGGKTESSEAAADSVATEAPAATDTTQTTAPADSTAK